MVLDYFLFYTEANAVCIAILLIMLISDRIQGTQQETQIRFNRTIIAHILYFVSDICWAAVLEGPFPRTRFTICLFNLTNYILLGALAYEWFIYMAVSEKMQIRRSRMKRMLCLLPLALSVLVLLIAYAADPFFWVSESGELSAWYYPMMIAAPVVYLLSAYICSVINARKAETKAEKTLYRLIGYYPLGVLGFGLIQTFFLNAPLFCFGCVIMMLFFYVQHLQTMISVDALTRLNNRGQIDRYMEQVRYKENTDLYIMMIDVDKFKHINDTYGHDVGDRALILVSETLKQTCERTKASLFIGRYGGDEFTVFIQRSGEAESPEQIAEIIRNVLSEKQRGTSLPYELNVSIGYDKLRDQNDTMQACMIRADQKLYEDKRRTPR